MTFNSTFKSPGKGLKRTAFKSKPPKLRTCAISQVAKPAPRARMKTSRPKATPIRQSARNEDCTIRLRTVCKVETGNVVWAHSNRAEHGKGGGLKADDEFGAYACFWCHCVYDRQHPRPSWMTLEDVEAAFDRGMEESRAKLREKGLIK